MTEETDVYPNHYGSSIVRSFLTSDALDGFKDSEIQMMQETTITIPDYKNPTDDKNTNAPNTGDPLSMIPCIMILIISGISAIITFALKRRNINQ